MDPAPAAPVLNIRFLYAFCGDIASVRSFYTEQLGLLESSHMDDASFGYVSYNCEGMQLMFFRWDDGELPALPGWAWQPGDGAGDVPVMSFAVHVPEPHYAEVVDRLVASGCDRMSDDPTWRQDSYWGLTVRDPAGHTVEVYTVPGETPSSTSWPGA